jgi:hypothetical protein
MSEQVFDSSEQQIPMKAIVDLKGYNFVIPFQQRGYKWTKNNIQELISDFLTFIDKGEEKKVYCLQPLAIVPLGDKKYEVLDGQQRLTTLFLLHKAIFGESPYKFEYMRDEKADVTDENSGINRWEFLSNLSGEIIDKTIDQFFISSAYSEILEELKNDSVKTKLSKLLQANSTEKSVQVIWYEVNENKRYETFRNLNSGKIPLSNTELIKALFLNRVSGLRPGLREQAATLFEEMEQKMRDDRFWYMFNSEEQKTGQSRLDFIFNLVAKCSIENYNVDPRWSFRNYFDNKSAGGTLENKWKDVRHTYLRLKDMFEDPYIYHYVGFLTYCNEKGCNAATLLSWNRKLKKQEFIVKLADKISGILMKVGDSLDNYNYDSGAKPLRRLFVIYNIETILSRFKGVNRESDLALRSTFERFPFELLHKQSWDIEHIASKTENDFSNSKDREDWLNSIKADLGEEYKNIKCSTIETEYQKSKKKGDFDELYKTIMKYCENKLGNDAIPDPISDDSTENNEKHEKDKNQLGNLTLLDSHTNRSFHNSLFPRKRRIVLVAGGLKPNDGEQNIKLRYIPTCTMQCFTKSYSRASDINLNIWTKRDAEEYYKDIEQKLSKYFKK